MIVLADCRINSSALSELKCRGFETILMPPAPYLQSGVASHTDMLIFVGFGRLFCHTLYYHEHSDIIGCIASLAGLKITVSKEPTDKKYPSDVLFNACIVGKNLICNTKTVSKLILNTADAEGFNIINVPQGYTKCSICIVSENSIITADKAIAKACIENGIDALTVSEGHVSLPPYNFGFLGGSSGVCGDKIYFCGSLDSHPNAEMIKNFCQTHKRSIISLSSDQLQDVGSLFFLNRIKD